MKKYLLPTNCNSYKANMYCHSTLSDGAMTPEELKEAYKAAGYSVLAITDHEGIFDHSYLDDENFLTIPSYEREINADADCWNNVITCHLCIYPKDRSNINTIAYDPDYTHPKFKWLHNAELKENMTYLGKPYKPYYSVESINYIISEAKKYGFLVTLNHLQWSQERYEQFSQYKGYDVSAAGTTDISAFVDAMKVSGYADLAMKWANGSGLIEGSEIHSVIYLDPQGDAIRSQTATMMMRFCEEVIK